MKTVIGGMIVAFIMTLSALSVSAQTTHKVSNVSFSQLKTGQYDNVVVNDAGKTGKEIYSLLNEWTKINGHSMIDTGQKIFILSQPHENSGASQNGLYPFWDQTPSGPAIGWEKPLFKEECCNLVADASNEKQMIELLKKFNQGNFISTTWSAGGNPKGDGGSSLDNNQNLNNKTHMDTIQVLVSGSAAVNAGATNSSAGLPLWATILIILGSLAVLALLIYFLRPRPGRDFINQLEDSWEVENTVLRQNRRRIRQADDFQSERNESFYEENQNLLTRYRTPHQDNHGGGH